VGPYGCIVLSRISLNRGSLCQGSAVSLKVECLQRLEQYMFLIGLSCQVSEIRIYEDGYAGARGIAEGAFDAVNGMFDSMATIGVILLEADKILGEKAEENRHIDHNS
jgi:hypothetical protein